MLDKNKFNLLFILLFVIGFLCICYFVFNGFIFDRIDQYKVSSYFDDYYDAVPGDSFSDGKYDKYVGVLEVPSIGLKRGFYSLNSKYNKVSNGIEVLNGSSFPNLSKSILMFASHSGNSNISYFKKLIYLKAKDLVYVYYDGIIYTYEISECFSSLKNGFITLRGYSGDKVLLLTTCRDDDLSKQFTCYGSIINERSF